MIWLKTAGGSGQPNGPHGSPHLPTELGALISSLNKDREYFEGLRLSSMNWRTAAAYSVDELQSSEDGLLPAGAWRAYPNATRAHIALRSTQHARNMMTYMQQPSQAAAALPDRVDAITLQLSEGLLQALSSQGQGEAGPANPYSYRPFFRNMLRRSCARHLKTLHILNAPERHQQFFMNQKAPLDTSAFGIRPQEADAILRGLRQLENLTMMVQGSASHGSMNNSSDSDNDGDSDSGSDSRMAPSRPLATLAFFPATLRSLKLITSTPLAPAALAGCTRLTELHLEAMWAKLKAQDGPAVQQGAQEAEQHAGQHAEQQAGQHAGQEAGQQGEQPVAAVLPVPEPLDLHLPDSLTSLALYTRCLRVDAAQVAACSALQHLTLSDHFNMGCDLSAAMVADLVINFAALAALQSLRTLRLNIQWLGDVLEMPDAAAALALPSLESAELMMALCSSSVAWQHLAEARSLTQLIVAVLVIDSLEAAPLGVTDINAGGTSAARERDGRGGLCLCWRPGEAHAQAEEAHHRLRAVSRSGGGAAQRAPRVRERDHLGAGARDWPVGGAARAAALPHHAQADVAGVGGHLPPCCGLGSGGGRGGVQQAAEAEGGSARAGAWLRAGQPLGAQLPAWRSMQWQHPGGVPVCVHHSGTCGCGGGYVFPAGAAVHRRAAGRAAQ